MRNTTVLLLCAFALGACASTAESRDAASLDELGSWMTGTFSSAAQSAEDPENFFAIRLVMIPVWEERDDGPWLYVEQAAEDRLERPYRQRVYHLVDEGAGRIRSEVFTLPGNPLDHAGCWKRDEPLGSIGPGNLSVRGGCAIHLTRNAAGEYVGATAGKGCESKLGTASYATSEVTITEALLTSWDRGYDANDQQVWGAEKGPYRFVKTSLAAP